MNRMIYLARLDHVPTPEHGEYTAEEMEAARGAMARRGLRWDNEKGILYNRDGWRSRFSNPADHVPYETEAEVMRWVFRPEIANSASRVRRGFTP